jgi:hypothetical protein
MEFTPDEIKVLGYGHKFVITGYGPTTKQLNKALWAFNRRVLLRDFFAQKEATPPALSRARLAAAIFSAHIST